MSPLVLIAKDVKPSNIVANRSRALARFEEVKLIDFAECHPIGHENLLDGGEFGTAIFRAPEVQLQLRNLGPPMDIWSLGATVSGRPFHLNIPSLTKHLRLAHQSCTG